MYSNVQPFINSDLTNCFQSQYTEIESLLFNLLDSPVKYTKHIAVRIILNIQQSQF